MKIIFFTGNSPRHISLCNTIAKLSTKSLVISEVKENFALLEENYTDLLTNHFRERLKREMIYFKDNGFSFESNCVSLKYGQSSSKYIENIIKTFNPDCAIISGSSILKKNIIDALGNIPKINLHLGITPFFRGSGCNFWPLFLKQPELIGATLLDLDVGIDEGGIIHQFNEEFKFDDDIHSIGNRVIKKSIKIIYQIIEGLDSKKSFQIFPQKDLNKSKTFRNKDFNESAFLKYKYNLDNGLLNIGQERYQEIDKKLFKLTWINK